MDLQDCFQKMKIIQGKILSIIEKDSDIEEEFDNLQKMIFEERILDNRHKLESLLELISKIAKNHHRQSNFFEKIQKILLSLKNDIKKHFSNYDIFKIFKSHKIIILFLIKEKIIKIEDLIIQKITKGKYVKRRYPEYFYSEIKDYLDEETMKELISEPNFSDDYEELRKKGENESYICELIRNDLIEPFISHISKNNIPLGSQIEMSLFETNNQFYKKDPTLIQYAAFYGSNL